MKALPSTPSSSSRAVRSAVLAAMGAAAAAVLFCSVTFAQSELSVEELEQLVEEQRIALEEAIANREATAAKAQEVIDALEQSEERRAEIEEELKALCEEQASLQNGSMDECMNNSES